MEPSAEEVSLRQKLEALAAWACEECGARFAQHIDPVLLRGVKRCSSCAARESLAARVKELELEVERLRAATLLAAEHRGVARGLLISASVVERVLDVNPLPWTQTEVDMLVDELRDLARASDVLKAIAKASA